MLRLPPVARECFAATPKYDSISVTPQFLRTAIPVASGALCLGHLPVTDRKGHRRTPRAAGYRESISARREPDAFFREVLCFGNRDRAAAYPGARTGGCRTHRGGYCRFETGCSGRREFRR